MMTLLLTAAVAGADQGAKRYVEEHVEPKEERTLLGGRMILRRVHNRGLMMNRLQEHPGWVCGGSVAALGVLLVWQLLLWRSRGHFPEKLGVALMEGGAVSNTLDRLLRGYVVDYAAVRTPSRQLNRVTFNLGDLAIVAGAVLAAAGSWGNTKSI